MNRHDLVSAIVEGNPSLPIREVEGLVTAFFETITSRLENGGRVELRRFGVFETRNRDERKGRNPRTGEAVEVKAKRVPYFKPAKELRKRVAADA
ncbi:HU family DNA-binding protein [Sphingomonas sp. PAMC 26621]|uniref:HU family DNA-binding protein n=1 Tax=Sphingomonas sp. PAMC 26621 TaxID=1112213 RepID=UPI000289B33E|nr:HU family DNA-binding protein [Sphingomonas sp. PAMC 26621]